MRREGRDDEENDSSRPSLRQTNAVCERGKVGVSRSGHMGGFKVRLLEDSGG